METQWLDDDERAAWLRLVAVTELLPGVLDVQLRTDAGLTHFEYFVLAMLSEAPERTLRLTALAQRTNATLPRLSHVVRRLEGRGLVERFPCAEDGRATNARLTDEGWNAVVAAAPGHVTTVRRHVLDALTPEQLEKLHSIGDALLTRLDPHGAMTALYDPEKIRNTGLPDRGKAPATPNARADVPHG
jgi:DNA-binding MarR family transcriptional regulator